MTEYFSEQKERRMTDEYENDKQGINKYGVSQTGM